MYPGIATIHVEDTVSFERTVPGPPRTVTFLSGAAPPPLFLPMPGGPPGAMVANPAAVAPSGDRVYQGRGVMNSGAMGLLPLPDVFTLTFETPGAFTYQCLLYPFQVGQIVVVEAGAPLPLADQAAVDALA
jgi:plastocyanin